jgi:hypothetical protein
MGVSIDLWDVVWVCQRKRVYCVLVGSKLGRGDWHVMKARNSDRVRNDGLDLHGGGSWFIVVFGEHRRRKRARSRKISWGDRSKDR